MIPVTAHVHIKRGIEGGGRDLFLSPLRSAGRLMVICHCTHVATLTGMSGFHLFTCDVFFQSMVLIAVAGDIPAAVYMSIRWAETAAAEAAAAAEEDEEEPGE